MIYGEINRITRKRSGMVIRMEATFDTMGFPSKKKAIKVPNHLRGGAQQICRQNGNDGD
jgi:hypothetical protein